MAFRNENEEYPDDVHTVYWVDTIYGKQWTDDVSDAIIALRNRISVEVWTRHPTRGWEPR